MAKKKKKTTKCPVRTVVVISDTHIGDRMGLCPPEGCLLDGGGRYTPNRTQQAIWKRWETFWGEIVPDLAHGEPYAVVLNGDALEGQPHESKGGISSNFADQSRLALTVLQPIVDAADGRFFLVRGTEAHVGKSAEREEELARQLGAIPDEDGLFSRSVLWMGIGDRLIQFLHTISPTSSASYEATALNKEIIEAMTSAALAGLPPPDIVARGHRHRYSEYRLPSDQGMCIAFATPSWQGPTQYMYTKAGARVSTPQSGGVVIRLGDHDFYTRFWVKYLGRPRVERQTYDLR